MKKRRFSEEQIIGVLKQHEAGVKTAELCQERAMDFIVDELATGRMVRTLSVVDAYTREPGTGSGHQRGIGPRDAVLERLIEERCGPEAMRSDNGPEVSCAPLVQL